METGHIRNTLISGGPAPPKPPQSGSAAVGFESFLKEAPIKAADQGGASSSESTHSRIPIFL